MRHITGWVGAIAMVLLAPSAPARAQTAVIQQQDVSAAREGASVTVSGQTVTVRTSSKPGHIVGDGQPASETRPIPAVSAITADGAFVVDVKIGSPPGLTVETDKNLLPIVKTAVANGTLEIYTDQSYSVEGRIKVSVTTPEIAKISASGSNEINGEGVGGERLTISLSGANHAVLRGHVAILSAELSGANHLAARQLTADSAEISLSGSGDATVEVRQRLVAEISGAGSIAVYGNPQQRSTQINGAGTIKFAE